MGFDETTQNAGRGVRVARFEIGMLLLSEAAQQMYSIPCGVLLHEAAWRKMAGRDIGGGAFTYFNLSGYIRFGPTSATGAAAVAAAATHCRKKETIWWII